MSNRVKTIFLLLVLAQGFHSIEEYLGQLWLVFPPATYVTGLISDNLERGFIIINVGLFIFGITSWYFLFRKNHPLANTVLILWIVIEIMNGIVHPAWTIFEAGYTPGVLTAPLLLILAIYLIKYKSREETS